MSKSIEFNIKISVDGKEVAITRRGVRELGRELGTARTAADRTFESIMKFGSLATVISGAYTAVGNLTGQMQGYIDKANAATEAQTKLATVMRQRIAGFEEGDVDALNKVVAAQTQLGVVSGTVQRNGLQQLATFATMRSTLETLLPAMNNLLVQQHGMNATGGDAVGIANLMGKALMGNTTALRRVGISFSDAQAALIKTGDEATRAATIAEVITQNVGEMNAALAKTDAGKVKQAQMAFGGMLVQVGRLLSPYQEFIALFGQLGMGIGSVAQLAGALRGVAVSLRLTSVAGRAWNAAGVRMNALVRTLGASMRGAAVSAGTLRLAVQGLMISTGIGIALYALSKAIGAVASSGERAAGSTDALAAAQERANATMEQGRDAVRQRRAQIEKDIAAAREFTGTQAQEQAAVERLNNTYGSTMGYFSSVAEWYKALTANSKVYCEQLVAEARQRALANQIAELEQQAHDIRYDGSGRRRRYSAERQRATVGMQGGVAGAFNVVSGEGVAGTSDAERAAASLSRIEGRVSSLRRQLEAATKSARGMHMAVRGADVRVASGASAATGRARTGRARAAATETLRQPVLQALPGVAAVSRPPETGRIGSFDDIAGMQLARAERLRERADRLRELWEGGVIDTSSARKGIDDLNASLEAMGAKRVELDIDTRGIDRARERMDGLGEAVRSAGQAFSSAGDAFALPALNVLGVVAQAVANVMLSYTQALAGAAKLGPIGWVAFAASGLATALGVVSQIREAAKFAAGGVVSGPTLAMVGEYAGARNNPEVIAPLDRLRGMIQPAGGAVVVGGEMRVRGTDLVAALANTTRLSGKKTGIRI